MNKFKKFLNCSASLTLLAIFFIIDVPSALYAFDRLATETDSQLLIENFRSQKGVWPTGFFSGN